MVPSMRYVRRTVARFGHCDPAGIVYYPRFFEWFHDHFEASFADVVGEPYARVLLDRRVGFPAVQLAAEFLAPVRFGDEVDLELFLSRLTERSATFEYRVRRLSGELCATASVKVASMDLDRQVAAPFPADVRSKLEPYLEPSAPEAPDPSRLRAGRPPG